LVLGRIIPHNRACNVDAKCLNAASTGCLLADHDSAPFQCEPFMPFVLAALLLLAALTPASAYSGHDLLKSCQESLKPSGNPIHFGLCFGTVTAVAQMKSTLPSAADTRGLFCPPAEVKNEILVRVVLKYLNDNPKILHFQATDGAFLALADAYPCPPKR
jgi:hypothetical protein